jgi:hypothetical protein
MKKFRVLVVDDKKQVLGSIKDRIEYSLQIGDDNFLVDLSCVEVEILKDKDGFKISEKTYSDLHEKCKKPFDLILLDFGFVNKELNAIEEILDRKRKSQNKTTREIIDEVVLNPAHLVKQIHKAPKYFRQIDKYFTNHSGPLFIYTYIPNKFERDYTSADVRRNVTNEHFPKANIQVIDARKELFNGNQFEDKHDKEFYPFLISKFISLLIQKEISIKALNQTINIKNKFQEIKKNNRLKLFSAVFLSIFTGFLIPTIIDSVKEGNNIEIVTFTVSAVFAMVFLMIIISTLEKRNLALFR